MDTGEFTVMYCAVLYVHCALVVLDSVIFVSKDTPDEYQPEIGHHLGQMSNELEGYGVGSYIDRFVGAGPKNYGFRIRKPDGTTVRPVNP